MWLWTALTHGQIRKCYSLTKITIQRQLQDALQMLFSATGQLWGNPLYDWKALKKDGYGWWVQRMTHCLELYDVVRIDHFRGFDEYYAIPYGDKTAERGNGKRVREWICSIHLIKKSKDLRVIAEDLGFLTESVLEMLERERISGNESASVCV